MELPGYVKDFLQTNYYLSDEDLALPFDQMPAYVRDLVSRTMNTNEQGEVEPKTEEEILKVAQQQFLADIDSDTLSQTQINNFIANQETLTKLASLADERDPDSDDFGKVASLMAAKRICSDEYADTPKDEAHFMQLRREIKTELEIKDYVGRYINAHPEANADPDAFRKQLIDVTAEISSMVRTNQSDKIAARFGLPDTEKDRAEAKGATLSFAMAELKSFSDRIDQQVKGLPFVQKVNALHNQFKEKYPKTYTATKILTSGAAAMTLGPAYSAYRATAGINAMRKDFAEYKKKNPDEKGSFWKFIRTPEGRKQLLTTGQNIARIIPGARAVGIVLSAVKNSEMLKETIKDLKENGPDKKRLLKFGAAAAGLLAVSVTAAYANDEVADMVHECFSNLDPLKDTLDQAIDHVSSFIPHSAGITSDLTAAADLTEASNNLADVAVNSDLTNASVNMADFTPSPDVTVSTPVDMADIPPTSDVSANVSVETAAPAPQAAENASVEAAAPAPQAAENVSAEAAAPAPQAAENASGDKITVNNITLTPHGVQEAHGTIEHADGSETTINTNGGGTTISHSDDHMSTRVGIGKDGSVSVKGRITNEVDPNKEGFTATDISYDTNSGSVGTVLTNNQTGDKIVIDHSSQMGQTVSYGDSLNNNGIEVTHNNAGVGISGHAKNVELGNGNTVRSVNAGIGTDGTVYSNGTIDHADGSATTYNLNGREGVLSHSDDHTSTSVGIGKDGSVSVKGEIVNDVDPTKKGPVVESVKYDTNDLSLQARIAQYQKGESVSVSASRNGGIGISKEDANGQSSSVSYDRSGLHIKGKSGKSVNVSREDISKGIGLIRGLLGGR